MAGHPEETPLPPEVVALLGADIVDHSGAGTCRVVSGGGLVAKVGPPDVVAREATVLRLSLPLAVPTLIDTGPGWLVTRAEADATTPWSDADLHAALADLARLHDAFECRSGTADDLSDLLPVGAAASLRRPFSPESAEAVLGPVRRLGFPLPARLAYLLGEPGLILEAAALEPPTLLHGDPWPGNILRPDPGRRVWVDWELASAGPSAADIASWLGQTPWHTGVPTDGHLATYLAARSRRVDRANFQRALDAATVLWFFACDVPRLAASSSHERAGAGAQPAVTIPTLAAAERLARGI
jgi:hypothetical protein